MDYQELNDFVDAYKADADVCTQKLREWQQGNNVADLDLRRPYLQVRVHRSVLLFQTVMIKGRRYCLTRLGFGLNEDPKIMSAIMNLVMAKDEGNSKGNVILHWRCLRHENVASSRGVKEYLERFSLVYNGPEPLQIGANILGLHVNGDGEKLHRRRGSDIPEVLPVITRPSPFVHVCETGWPFSRLAQSGGSSHKASSREYSVYVRMGRRGARCFTLRYRITETIEWYTTFSSEVIGALRETSSPFGWMPVRWPWVSPLRITSPT